MHSNVPLHSSTNHNHNNIPIAYIPIKIGEISEIKNGASTGKKKIKKKIST